jgi:cytidine deaminase
MKIDAKKLVHAAAQSRAGSVSPYSKFKVGAALLTRAGKIIGGANVESASYGLTCCAERIALFKALTEGEKEFVAVAVVARWKGGPMPAARAGSCWPNTLPKPKCWWRTATIWARSRCSPCAGCCRAPFV